MVGRTVKPIYRYQLYAAFPAKLENKKILLGQSVFLPHGITLFVSIDFGLTPGPTLGYYAKTSILLKILKLLFLARSV